MRLLTALLAVLAASALAACGAAGTDSSTDFQGTQREVASTIENLQSAASDDDPSQICRTLLASSLVSRLGGAIQCQKAVRIALDGADSNDLDVQQVQVSGATATARVKSGKGDGSTVRTVRLQREGSNWKVASL